MPQQRTGDILRARREELGVSIAQAAQQTNIRARVLVIFESCDYSHYPPKGYSQGMVSSYARYLRLDSKEITKLLEMELDAFEAQKNAASAEKESAAHNAAENTGSSRKISWKDLRNPEEPKPAASPIDHEHMAENDGRYTTGNVKVVGRRPTGSWRASQVRSGLDATGDVSARRDSTGSMRRLSGADSASSSGRISRVTGSFDQVRSSAGTGSFSRAAEPASTGSFRRADGTPSSTGSIRTGSMRRVSAGDTGSLGTGSMRRVSAGDTGSSPRVGSDDGLSKGYTGRLSSLSVLTEQDVQASGSTKRSSRYRSTERGSSGANEKGTTGRISRTRKRRSRTTEQPSVDQNIFERLLSALGSIFKDSRSRLIAVAAILVVLAVALAATFLISTAGNNNSGILDVQGGASTDASTETSSDPNSASATVTTTNGSPVSVSIDVAEGMTSLMQVTYDDINAYNGTAVGAWHRDFEVSESLSANFDNPDAVTVTQNGSAVEIRKNDDGSGIVTITVVTSTSSKSKSKK